MHRSNGHWKFARGALAAIACVWGCASGFGSSPPIARVNGEPITRAELERYRESRAAGDSGEARGERFGSDEATALEAYVEHRLLVQEAERRGLREDSGARRAVDPSAEYALIGALIASVIEAEVTDQSVRRYYDEHPEQFSDRPARYRFLLVPPPLASPVFRALRKKLDFDAISEDFAIHFETSDRCDDWEYREQMKDPLFAAAIERLDEPGEKIGVTNGHGYALIERLPAPPPAEPDPFERVERDLRLLLSCESEAFLKAVLRGSADVEILDPSLDRVTQEEARAECESSEAAGGDACDDVDPAKSSEAVEPPARSESEIRDEALATAREACSQLAVRVSRATCP